MKNKNLMYEGIANSFMQSPFSFLFGAHFLQSILKEPERGENEAFEKWMEENGALPDAVEQATMGMDAAKLSPDEMREKGFDSFVGEEETATMAKAMAELPPELQAKFEGAMSDKAAKAYGDFQDSAKAALRITKGVSGGLDKQLLMIVSTLDGSGAEKLFPKEHAQRISKKLNDELGIYQKAIVQKIVAFENVLKEKISKSKDNKLAGKLNLGDFSLDEILKEEEGSQARQSAKMTLDAVTDGLDEYNTKVEQGVKQFVRAINRLKNILGTGSLGIEADQALKWADSVETISKRWLKETQEVVLEVMEQVESALEKAISEPKRDQEKGMNESRRRKTFYESFGDFS